LTGEPAWPLRYREFTVYGLKFLVRSLDCSINRITHTDNKP